jgi:2-dehydro-3-deoxyphosphogluconate aldolase/(4S)-4-hydroxy-2-oxoglutarate aldolase
MAQFSRIALAQLMEKTGLVPLFYHPDPCIGKEILKACYDGGVRVLEFTARGTYSHEVFAELSKYAAKELPELALGIGSVTDAASASLYMQIGASFIVTPSLREDIAIACNRRKVMYLPGCGSATEIAKAEELGCEIIKLFPGAIYGSEFVKAIKGPCPWTSIMPTGGVSPTKESLKDWFSAGVTCVGMGSKLISDEVIANKSFESLRNQTRELINLIKELR